MKIKLAVNKSGHRYGWLKAWIVHLRNDSFLLSLAWGGTGAWVNNVGESRVRYRAGIIECYRRDRSTYETILFLGPLRASFVRRIVK